MRCSASPTPFLPAHPCICTQNLPRPHADERPSAPNRWIPDPLLPIRTHAHAANIQHMHSNTVTTHVLYSHIPRKQQQTLPICIPAPHLDIPQMDSAPHIPPMCAYTSTGGCHFVHIDQRTPPLTPGPSHCAPIPLWTPSSPPSPFYWDEIIIGGDINIQYFHYYNSININHS